MEGYSNLCVCVCVCVCVRACVHVCVRVSSNGLIELYHLKLLTVQKSCKAIKAISFSNSLRLLVPTYYTTNTAEASEFV